MSYIGTEPKDIRSFGRTKFDYTATQGQTAFTGADDDGKVLAFTVGQIEVYVNGILMDDSDFTTTGTGTVTLASAANLNDVINIVSFESNIPDNDYVPASGGTFSGNVTHSGTVTNSGAVTNSSTVTNSGNVTVGGTLGVTGATTMSGNLEVDGIIEIDKTGDHPALRFVEDGSNTRAYMGSGDWAINGLANDDFGISSSSTGDLVLGTGAGTERLRIDNSGRVTMPNQPAWVAYANSRTGWTTTGLQKTPYDSVLHAEPNSAYSTTNWRYTAPVAGRYWVQISQNGISDIILYIYKNGSLYHGGEFRSSPTGTWEHYTIGTVVQLSVNDYLEAYVKLGNSGGHAWNGGSSTWDHFSGFLIG